MTTYSHRDHRAFRQVNRGLAAVAGLSVALAGLALWAPTLWLAVVAIAGIVVAGAAYVAYSDLLLEAYAADLAGARAPAPGSRFRRVEAVTKLGRVGRARRPSPSPHSRPAPSPGVPGPAPLHRP